MNPPVVLSVAGTDSGGAAGIPADLATFAALGAHGTCVVTAVTAQDTTGVHAVHPVPPALVAAQWDAVLDDLPVAAVKTGMLGSAEVVRAVAERYDALPHPRPPLVVDPVLVATSGAVLGDDAVRDAYVATLLPLADVVTPNLAEARALARAADVDPTLAPPDLAAALTSLGPAVLLTGGPDEVSLVARRGEARGSSTCGSWLDEVVDRSDVATDWLARPGIPPGPIRHPVVATVNDHGTGCTHSAALASYLGRGWGLDVAAAAAAEFVTTRLRRGSSYRLGRGRGPVSHLPSAPGHDHLLHLGEPLASLRPQPTHQEEA